MKKLRFILPGLLALALLSSCEKQKMDDMQISAKDVTKSAHVSIMSNIVSSPLSGELNITPYLIPGENRGGNRTCEEVAMAFDATFVACGEKIDYNGNFMGSFPDGLTVTVDDGKFITFDMADCLLVDGMHVKVGAVIVKGSNAANIYYYPEGAMFDTGLAAPVNASGQPAGLSNLTFCFVECDPQVEPEVLYIALKAFVDVPGYTGNGDPYVRSAGEVFASDLLKIGYVQYVPSEGPLTFDLKYGDLVQGTFVVDDYTAGGVHYLEVVIDAGVDTWTLMKSYLYAGTLEVLEASIVDQKLDYVHFPFYEDGILAAGENRVFTVPFSDLIY